MKKIIQFIKHHLNKGHIRKKEQQSRFEYLELMIMCLQTKEHLTQFDDFCDVMLTEDDMKTARFYWLLVKRGEAELLITGDFLQLQYRRIIEGDHLLKKIGLN